MLFVVLHLIFYLVMGLSLCGYMHFLIWRYCEHANGRTAVAIIMPTLGNVVTLLLAWAVGITESIEGKMLTTQVDIMAFMVITTVAAVLSIRRYTDEEKNPNFVSFAICTGYNLLILAGSAALVFLA